jgi:uncharacterized protein YkwD
MDMQRMVVASTAVFVLLIPSGAGTANAAGGDRGAVAMVVPAAAARIVGLINRDRAAAGLVPLRIDPAAGGVADGWSRQMARAAAISHNGQFLSPASLARFDARIVGENVAVGGTIDQIHQLLMASPPHRRNILHPDFRLVGVAAVRTPAGRVYLTEDFLTRQDPRSTSPRPGPRSSPTGRRRR